MAVVSDTLNEAADYDAGVMLVYDLPRRCTIAEAMALREDLLLQLSSGQSITLNAGPVQDIDAAGLQLLTAFARDIATAGRPVRWQSAPAVLTEGAARLGLCAVLGLENVQGLA
jgi:ABC-type transporter Mla MlaB component